MESISLFLYFMWNRWSLQECEAVWPNHMSKHYWEKWQAQCIKYGPFGGAATFWAELDNTARKTLWSHIESTYKLD